MNLPADIFLREFLREDICRAINIFKLIFLRRVLYPPDKRGAHRTAAIIENLLLALIWWDIQLLIPRKCRVIIVCSAGFQLELELVALKLTSSDRKHHPVILSASFRLVRMPSYVDLNDKTDRIV